MRPNAILALTTIVLTAPAAVLVAQTATEPLKEAKLIIEHNATDNDTGFQGFIDSEGWQSLTVTGPSGDVLYFEGRGALAELGITELFFETVEPENADVPIEEMLEKLAAGEYLIEGPLMIDGESGGMTTGTAILTHAIPNGPELIEPAEGAIVSAEELRLRWGAVDTTITGDPVTIVSYQLIVEKAEEPGPNAIGKRGLSIYLPADVTELEIPEGFLEPAKDYMWEVLAIEESGNQTLSSGAFTTR